MATARRVPSRPEGCKFRSYSEQGWHSQAVPQSSCGGSASSLHFAAQRLEPQFNVAFSQAVSAGPQASAHGPSPQTISASLHASLPIQSMLQSSAGGQTIVVSPQAASALQRIAQASPAGHDRTASLHSSFSSHSM
jgi:hypothetical protein